MQYTIPAGATIMSINDSFAKCEGKYTTLEGLKIETDKGNVVLLIDTDGQYCENFGNDFLETPDDINKYIGAKIIAIEDTNNRELNPNDEESSETQLKIVTNRGVLQYAVYNSHNGYYSHSTFLQVFDFVEKSSL